MTDTNTHIGLIYAGGTFGSHGTPLSPLDKGTFLPILQNKLSNHPIHPLAINLVKDSSTLTPDDFYVFYQQIVTAYQDGFTKILLITGTDTLAYLSAFLSFSLKDLSVTVVVTGSMLPLLHHDRYEIDSNSDAFDNLKNGLDFLQNNPPIGTFVSFYKQIFYGNSVQKIHSSDKNAFVGKTVKQPVMPTSNTPQRANHLHFLSLTDPIFCPIHSVFTLPNNPETTAQQLSALSGSTPTAVLILGFGAGNLVDNIHIRNAINTLINQGFLVIMSSQCPFGERSSTYAVGAWQSELGVLSGGDLPIPALYAKALWVCLSHPVGERVNAWNAVN